MNTLRTVLNCQNAGCPKSNIWQSLMILSLCGMAVTLACMGVAADSFKEVMYVLAGAIAFIKFNWNQGQMLRQGEMAVAKAETAVNVAVDTKKSLEEKIDKKSEELKQATVEARDTAAEAVLVTIDGNKLLEKVHESTNGAAKKKEEEAYQKGLAEAQGGSKF